MTTRTSAATSTSAADVGAGAGAPTIPAQVRRYLGAPCLQPVWAGARARLERNRLAVRGVVTVTLDEDGADRLGGLLGTPARAGVTRLRLELLDQALRRSAAGCGLLATLEQLGGPVLDRAAARDSARATRTALWADVDAALASAGLEHAPWVPGFTEALRRSGMLTRAGDDAPEALRHAGVVLAELAPALGTGDTAVFADPVWELAELASGCTGTAHGLDDTTVTAALVLRTAAAALGVPVPATAAQRRELWERLGVTTDVVSGTVLAWNLRPHGLSPWATMMRQRADLGLVTHLTVHELRASTGSDDLLEEGAVVSACENPQVLQAAARAGATQTLVCLSGNPASAGWLLVRQLLAAGVKVRYHGDFDWPGVAIAGRLYAAGVSPWRFDAASYRAAVASRTGQPILALSGRPVPTPWDTELGAAMAASGVAIHEESVVSDLLGDLNVRGSALG